MNNNITGIERIGVRIKAEAEQLAAAEIAEAENEAEKIRLSAKAVSDEKITVILKDAAEKAESVSESAKSGAGMRERNARLALKVEMLEKAFDRALEKLICLDENKYVNAMSKLLAETANKFLADGACAVVCFGKKDKPCADKILTQAKENIKVKADLTIGEKELGAAAGFVLAIGDTEINCIAETLIDCAKKTLEKPVLDILFPAN